MSGGSYDYFYSRLEHVADQVSRSRGIDENTRPALRRAFAAHLCKVAEAMRSIEWNDSGDGDGREIARIEAVIGPNAELAVLIAEAKSARAELDAALERAATK